MLVALSPNDRLLAIQMYNKKCPAVGPSIRRKKGYFVAGLFIAPVCFKIIRTSIFNLGVLVRAKWAVSFCWLQPVPTSNFDRDLRRRFSESPRASNVFPTAVFVDTVVTYHHEVASTPHSTGGPTDELHSFEGG